MFVCVCSGVLFSAQHAYTR